MALSQVLALLSTLIAVAFANIQIFNPSSLKETLDAPDGIIEAGMANFGHIDYGSSILGQVFVPLTNKEGCETFTKSMFDEAAQEAIFQNKIAVELPVILLQRGNCTFVTKVRNVEKAGANIALIGDTKEEVSEIYVMSDDGSGHSINIPSFFIRKETADAFRDSYENGDSIIIKVKIETAQTNSTTTVDLWQSTPFDLSLTALKGLREYIPRLDSDKLQFHLKIRSKPCIFCEVFEQQQNCLSEGMFCALAPTTHDEEFAAYLDLLDGKSQMLQSLRAKCVHMVLYEYSNDQGGALQKSLDYMYYFRANCTSIGDFAGIQDVTCANSQMQQLGIDSSIVQDCIDNSFEQIGDYDTVNILLDQDTVQSDRLGIYLHPGMTINDMTYRGYIEGADVFDAVCSSFPEQPKECTQSFEDEISYDFFAEHGFKSNNDPKYARQGQVRRTVMYGILIILLFIQIIFFIWYRMKKQREIHARMNLEVAVSVREYMSVNTGSQADIEQTQENNAPAGVEVAENQPDTIEAAEGK